MPDEKNRLQTPAGRVVHHRMPQAAPGWRCAAVGAPKRYAGAWRRRRGCGRRRLWLALSAASDNASSRRRTALGRQPAIIGGVTQALPLFIVFNPRSGHGDADDVQRTIETVLQDAGRRHTLLRVQSPAQLAAIAEQAAQQAQAAGGALVAAGGDGTLNTVAQAALRHQLPFGVLPQGTFNYFGRAHGVPEDTQAAVAALLDAQIEPTQVGQVNERIFLVNASVGLYPQLLEDREAFKREYGRSRLVALWAALVTLCSAHRPLRLALQTGGQTQQVRTPTLFVGNNALQLEQTGLAHAALEQGSLVAVTLEPLGTLALLGLMLRGAFGQLGEAASVHSFACQHLRVQPAAPFGRARMKVATDGEVGLMRAPLVFQVAPQRLQLLKPRATETAG